MNKRNTLKMLREGRYKEWNQYRLGHPDWNPDLKNIGLQDIDFRNNFFDMREADLRGASLPARLFWPIVPEKSKKVKMPSWMNTIESDLNSSDFNGATYDISTKFQDPSDATYFSKIGGRFVNEYDFRDGVSSTLPKIFISYGWKDKEVVRAIAKWLHTKGLIIRIDIGAFFAGGNIRGEILRVMKECEVILIFYSANSKDRPWVTYERELAYDLEMEAKTNKKKPPRVVYVALDNSPLPDPISKNRIAINAKGRKFIDVCRQIHDQILMIPGAIDVDLRKWRKRTL